MTITYRLTLMAKIEEVRTNNLGLSVTYRLETEPLSRNGVTEPCIKFPHPWKV